MQFCTASKYGGQKNDDNRGRNFFTGECRETVPSSPQRAFTVPRLLTPRLTPAHSALMRSS